MLLLRPQRRLRLLLVLVVVLGMLREQSTCCQHPPRLPNQLKDIIILVEALFVLASCCSLSLSLFFLFLFFRWLFSGWVWKVFGGRDGGEDEAGWLAFHLLRYKEQQ
jgi:hypothetical protein